MLMGVGWGRMAAIEWWHAGEWDKLYRYCMQDVEVTERVFLAFASKHGLGRV